MNLQEIEKILEKYFNGESSLDEEKLLRKFFVSGEVPAKWHHLAEYFRFMAEERKVNLENLSFDRITEEKMGETRLSRLIDFRRPWIYWAAGIAASVLILIAIFVKFDPISSRLEETYDDPEIAYVQAKKVLMFVSTKMNKGTRDLQQVEKLTKGIKNLQAVATYDQSLDGINRLNDVDKVKDLISNN